MRMKIIDAHCHLDRQELYSDLDRVIAEARETGVAFMVTAAVEPDRWIFTRDLARGLDCVAFTIGMHPWIAAPLTGNETDTLAGAREFGAVAIGEIGLDRMIRTPSLEAQIPVFEQQLAIARDAGLPVVLHVRRAYGEMYRSLKRVGVPQAGGYIHNFTGSAETARDFLRFGLSFSMGGVLTYGRTAKRDAVVRLLYPGRLLLETDAPDILPRPFRGVPNRPAYIVQALAAAAEILGVDKETVAENTAKNAARILGLSL